MSGTHPVNMWVQTTRGNPNRATGGRRVDMAKTMGASQWAHKKKKRKKGLGVRGVVRTHKCKGWGISRLTLTKGLYCTMAFVEGRKEGTSVVKGWGESLVIKKYQMGGLLWRKT